MAARAPLRSVCTRCVRRPVSSLSRSNHARQLQLQSFNLTIRRSIQTERLTGFAPPTPESLGKAVPAKQYKRTIKWLRRLAYLTLFSAVVYTTDKTFNASALTRSLRTFRTAATAALDYKINFRENPPFGGDITAVHRRNAIKFNDLLRTNGGLYLKIGQAIAMQSAVLPPEFQKMFAKMFDDAPQNEWKDVEKLIREDFGASPEEVFGVSFTGEEDKGVMEKAARASASVAQVHWAKLADGREVAIKIQKREIARQVGWDLFTFKVVAWIYSKWFDIPFYSLVPFISERLMLETDFENEANNSELMKERVQGEPRLRNRVYIPKVYRELSSKRVMTAEWVEGVRLWDKDSITRPWRGGYGKGSPGCHGTPLDDPRAKSPGPTPDFRRNNISKNLKPSRTSWKGPRQDGGLGLSLKEVMTTMVDLFSAQMFLWGLVHCDPHPGNIFIRRRPDGHSELVLIDHGLYINMSPKFRHQYSTFWKALMAFDNNTMKSVVSEWGVKNVDIFASATLMKPYEGGDHTFSNSLRKNLSTADAKKRQYEMQQSMRKAVRDILGDEEKWPRELIFIGRNMRIVQGNNQFLGSPVNRLRITGEWASRSLTEDPNLPLRIRWKNYGYHLSFKFVLWASDLFWWWSRLKQWAGRGKGMEDDMEEQMKRVAKGMGVELNHDLFEG